jgi:ParB/RepB/Spo0J family partition protein
MQLLIPSATKRSAPQNAASIKHNGLIQPITVRPNNEGFEIVAGARRFRAAQIAELFSNHAPPARVGKLRIASIRNPTRKTVTQTNTIAIHAQRSSPSLALGLFNA